MEEVYVITVNSKIYRTYSSLSVVKGAFTRLYNKVSKRYFNLDYGTSAHNLRKKYLTNGSGNILRLEIYTRDPNMCSLRYETIKCRA